MATPIKRRGSADDVEDLKEDVDKVIDLVGSFYKEKTIPRVISINFAIIVQCLDQIPKESRGACFDLIAEQFLILKKIVENQN